MNHMKQMLDINSALPFRLYPMPSNDIFMILVTSNIHSNIIVTCIVTCTNQRMVSYSYPTFFSSPCSKYIITPIMSKINHDIIPSKKSRKYIHRLHLRSHKNNTNSTSQQNDPFSFSLLPTKSSSTSLWSFIVNLLPWWLHALTLLTRRENWICLTPHEQALVMSRII